MDFPPTSSGDIVVTPKTGHLYITPVGFITRAEDLLEASVLLTKSSGRFTFVAAHLACWAIEMALKAYLLARRYSRDQVKDLGHNLHDLLIENWTLGLGTVVDLTRVERAVLLGRINDDYMARNFAYFDINSAIVLPRNPDLDLLPIIARKLVEGVKPVCSKAADGNWTPLASDSST